MSEETEINLENQYKNIVKSTENSNSNEPVNLGSVNMDRYNPQKAQDADFHLGYHSLDLSELPSGGMFYPKDIQIKIRSAKAAEIRHFSTINENNLMDVEEGLNLIVNKCTLIQTNSKRLSYKDLCEEDRIIILLKVRDLTFPEPENQIILKGKNEKGIKGDIELSPKNMVFNQIPEEIAKYYDSEKRVFVIKTKSAGKIIMRPPSIGVMEYVTKYLIEKQQKDVDFDKAFIQVLPYLIEDWRELNFKKMFDMEIDYSSWSSTKFMLVYRLAEKMKIGIDTTLEKEIEGDVVKAPLDFPGGIKSLFIISDLSGELL
jgi:hypothetical protein